VIVSSSYTSSSLTVPCPAFGSLSHISTLLLAYILPLHFSRAELTFRLDLDQYTLLGCTTTLPSTGWAWTLRFGFLYIPHRFALVHTTTQPLFRHYDATPCTPAFRILPAYIILGPVRRYVYVYMLHISAFMVI
jgi:hypothetical protein